VADGHVTKRRCMHKLVVVGIGLYAQCMELELTLFLSRIQLMPSFLFISAHWTEPWDLGHGRAMALGARACRHICCTLAVGAWHGPVMARRHACWAGCKGTWRALRKRPPVDSHDGMSLTTRARQRARRPACAVPRRDAPSLLLH